MIFPKIMSASFCRIVPCLVVKQISVQNGEESWSQYCFWKAACSYANAFFDLRSSFSAVHCSWAAVLWFFFFPSGMFCWFKQSLSNCLFLLLSFFPFFLCPHTTLPQLLSHTINLPEKLIYLKNNNLFSLTSCSKRAVFHLDRFLDLVSCRAVQTALPRTSGLDSGQGLLRLTKAALLPKVKQQIPLQQSRELHIAADPDRLIASIEEGFIFLTFLTQEPFFQISELN